ncbi:7-cyano-7-deazaguanine synthase [Streptomyces antimycoticus]|uniref:7-cyano-7-deazaguanine synthase n=1 Tax=Streptomyces antimycoticus TaxID=68175 RepID=UPI00382FB56B
MPVARPERWDRALASLTAVPETVTDDLWEVVFRPLGRLPALAQKSVREGPLTFTDEDYAHDVALFSGGLDSLGRAAQQAALPFPRALLLVTFAERNFEALQDQVYEAVRGLRRRPVRRLTQSQAVRKPRGSGIELELTTRSRGLLYAATAVHAAAAEHVPVVHPPENGQLALNPPPSAARAGACSTRSVHPWTVHHLNRVISEVAEPGSAIRVENPFATLTKGDVCAAAHDAGMPQRVLEPTLSCGAPPDRRPAGPALTHCGLCYPCLVRRSGLVPAFGEDRTPYAADPWDPDLPASRTGNWQALRRWLDTEWSMLDLVADAPLPPDTQPASLMEVVERGREELRALIAWAGKRTPRKAS